jgi:hypothetical protein
MTSTPLPSHLQVEITSACHRDRPREAVYVTGTGAVQPCCMVMGDDRVTLGHLAEQSFPGDLGRPGLS